MILYFRNKVTTLAPPTNQPLKVWIEQPEGYPTCLATKPYPKEEVAHHFKKLNLCKSALR
jgi:hypothetical protein